MMKRSSDDGSPKKTNGRSQRRRVKVLLADDHTMFREGLAGMLASSYTAVCTVIDPPAPSMHASYREELLRKR